MTRFTAFSSALILSLFTCGVASAADNDAAVGGATHNDGGGYATDATDRGGRASGQTPADGPLGGSAQALLEWLRGLRG